MKILTNQPIRKATIIDSYVNEDNISILSRSNEIHITSFSKESLQILASKSIQIKLHPLSNGVADEDCVYLPTEGPDILVIDKLYGEILSEINCGSGIIMSDVLIDDKKIYAIVGVPLSHVGKTSDSKCSIVVSDKQTGQTLGKTMLFDAIPNGIQVDGQQLYSASNRLIYSFSKECEKQHEAFVQFNVNNIKLIWDYLFAISESTVEIFYRNLNRAKNLFFPGKIKLINGKDKCMAISNNNLFDIDKSLEVKEVSNFNYKTHCETIIGNHIYASDNKTNLIKINTNNGTVSKLNINDNNILNIHQVDESSILVVTKFNLLLVSI